MYMQSLITRSEPRIVDQRSEPRRTDLVERALIQFRGQEYLVPVIDVSSRGTRVACDIQPRIGEAVIVQFEDCSRISAFVRWVRDGQVGLNFGHEIVLCA